MLFFFTERELEHRFLNKEEIIYLENSIISYSNSDVMIIGDMKN